MPAWVGERRGNLFRPEADIGDADLGVHAHHHDESLGQAFPQLRVSSMPLWSGREMSTGIRSGRSDLTI